MGSQWWQAHLPVKRERAALYLRTMLLSFAVSVVVVRVYLELLNYPQIGGGNWHIAHVLWGGLVLYFGALLPLLVANRWAFSVSAVTTGVGMGLFIDEIGKFISASNDYFYAPALPIMYAFFLLSGVLYLRVRRPPSHDVRAELYRVFDGLNEVLESDLNEGELMDLKRRLRMILREAAEPNLRQLATALLASLESEALQVLPDRHSWWQTKRRTLRSWEERLMPRHIVRPLIQTFLLLVGVSSVIDGGRATLTFFWETYRERWLAQLLASGDVIAQTAFGLFVVRLLLEGFVGISLLFSVYRIWRGQEKNALRWASLTLLVYLTTVNLLVLYFDQFQALLSTLGLAALYLLVQRYRLRFFREQE